MDMKRKEPTPDLEADFDPEEIQAAAEEVTDPGVEPAPEVTALTGNLTEWDEAPGNSGVAKPKVPADDENAVGQELVEDGVESADRDQRLAAADPDYEG